MDSVFRGGVAGQEGTALRGVLPVTVTRHAWGLGPVTVLGNASPLTALSASPARRYRPCRTQCLVTPLADGESLSGFTARRAVPGREAVGRIPGTGAAAGAGRGVRPGEFPAGSGRREAEASAGGSAAGGSTARDRTAKPPAREVGVDDRSGAAGASGTERRNPAFNSAGGQRRRGGAPSSASRSWHGPASARPPAPRRPATALRNSAPARRPPTGPTYQAGLRRPRR